MLNMNSMSLMGNSYIKKNRKIPNNRKTTRGRKNLVQIINFFDKKKKKNISRVIIHNNI